MDLDQDLGMLDRDAFIAEVKRLRSAIREPARQCVAV